MTALDYLARKVVNLRRALRVSRIMQRQGYVPTECTNLDEDYALDEKGKDEANILIMNAVFAENEESKK